MTSTPRRVGVVVVNYDGGDLTLECLRSLLGTDWPIGDLEIVLVDNASTDGVADRVEADLAPVRIVRSATNTGFAGGSNLGIRALDRCDFVGLVNNDATVDPGWLRPLVDTLDAEPELGAACPKILLRDRFRELDLRGPTRRAGPLDHRALGIRISGARIDGVDVWSRVRLGEGFWGAEPPDRAGEGEWTSQHARVLVPVWDPSDGGVLELRVGARGPSTWTVTAGDEVIELLVPGAPTWLEAPNRGPAQTLVNNVGTELTDLCEGRDRGYLEPDNGRFDEPVDVFAWCGAGVLLRDRYLDDVGLFDERLFLYYEDVELSWRGRQRGWRYRTAPSSVIHHLHAGTSVERSALKDHYNDRNLLLVATRHAEPGRVRHVIARYLITTASYARRDVLARLLRGARPHASIVARRGRAFGAFVVRFVGAVRSRGTSSRRGAIGGATASSR